MSAVWKSAGERPQVAEGTKLALRMRGTRFGAGLIEEIDGFYLNAYGLHFDDGCPCFATEEEADAAGHIEGGCPCTGFYLNEPTEDFEEGLFQDFRCTEWRKL